MTLELPDDLTGILRYFATDRAPAPRDGKLAARLPPPRPPVTEEGLIPRSSSDGRGGIFIPLK